MSMNRRKWLKFAVASVAAAWLGAASLPAPALAAEKVTVFAAASLKNALDVGSRPAGKNVWRGKPAAVISGSTGGIGGFGANHALRQSLVYLDVPALPQPEAYVGNFATLFDAEGRLARDDTRTFLTQFMAAFGAWIDRNRG